MHFDAQLKMFLLSQMSVRNIDIATHLGNISHIDTLEKVCKCVNILEAINPP